MSENAQCEICGSKGTCVDCATAAEDAAFMDRLRVHPDLHDDLVRRWWRSPPPIRSMRRWQGRAERRRMVQPAKPRPFMCEPPEPQSPEPPRGRAGDGTRTGGRSQAPDGALHADYENDRDDFCDYLDTLEAEAERPERKSALGQSDSRARMELNAWLLWRRDEDQATRMPPGCHCVVLTEQRKALQAEIAHYERRARLGSTNTDDSLRSKIEPSAKRINLRLNPTRRERGEPREGWHDEPPVDRTKYDPRAHIYLFITPPKEEKPPARRRRRTRQL